ncbi:MAG TPA: hypothetical protein VFP36_01130 [Usitatibacter sp.]|nr:hypothetical protein [Usitatibacter sp.]
MGLMDILSKAIGSNDPTQHLDQAVQQAPNEVVASGISEAFKSDRTPDIGSMVGQLFEKSNATQQAGMLNSLIATLGPAVVASLAGGTVGKVMEPGQAQVTPQQASQLTPQQVQAVVNHANEVHPGIADSLGSFYANHKGLVNTLGGIAASIVLMKMKDHMTNR